MDKVLIQEGLRLGLITEAGNDEPWRDIMPRPLPEGEENSIAVSRSDTDERPQEGPGREQE